MTTLQFTTESNFRLLFPIYLEAGFEQFKQHGGRLKEGALSTGFTSEPLLNIYIQIM